MSKLEKIIRKLLRGFADQNFAFKDLIWLLKRLNFDERIKGSHHIFYKDEIEEIINLQPKKDGKAKPYQVKQVRTIIINYQLLRNINEEPDEE